MVAFPSPREHHFIPEFYVRRWTSAVPMKGMPVVLEYHRGGGEPTFRPPKRVASRSGLYRVAADATEEGDPEVIEHLLSKIESNAAQAMQFVDENGHVDHAKHRRALARFVAIQAVRTEKQLLVLEHRAREMARTYPEELIDRQGGMKLLLRKLRRRGAVSAEFAADDARAVARQTAESIAASREFRLDQMLRLADKILPHLHSMNWSVVTAEGAAQFITSDQPVLLPELGSPKGWAEVHGVGFATPGVEVWLPLDPDHAVVASKQRMDPIATLSSARVRLINEMLASDCFEFVVTHRRRPLVAKLMASLTPNRAPRDGAPN